MNSYKTEIAKSLSQVLEVEAKQIESFLGVAPSNIKADLSLPCFNFSKVLKKSPVQIAKDLATNVVPPEFVTQVEALNGYLNFTLDKKKFFIDVLSSIHTKKEKYGSNALGTDQTVVVDYSSPNMGKELAFHHLRGTMLGNALCRIFEHCGCKVVRINHLGDWGTSYGKLIVMYQKQKYPPIEEHKSKLTISHLNDLYKQFSEEAKKNPELEEEARKAFEKLENGHSEYLQMWKVFKEITLKELKFIYKMLNVEFDHYTGEAFFVKQSHALIEELKQKKLWSSSQGAEIVDLSTFELPPLMLKKSDGSTVYATRDLCAALYREETFHFSKCYYVVDNGQSLHFEQFFKVLELMERDWFKNCHHIPFGLILNKNEEGKWERGKTRAGQSKLLKDVITVATQKILKIIDEKNFNLENKNDTAQKIAIGALVFNDLKHKRQHDVKFDWDQVLSFEGDTGPYIINAYVRLSSILRKKKAVDPLYNPESIEFSNLDFSLCQSPTEIALVECLSLFPDKVKAAYTSLEPFIIGQYALSLADKSHSFIHACRVVGSPEEKERLALVNLTAQVVKNSLSKLGIPVIEYM